MSTGEPTAAAKATHLPMHARASSVSRSTWTNAPLGQVTGASAVSASSCPSVARRVSATARSTASSSATSAGISASSSPAQGPSASRSAIWLADAAALSCGMAAEPVDIDRNSVLERADDTG